MYICKTIKMKTNVLLIQIRSNYEFKRKQKKYKIRKSRRKVTRFHHEKAKAILTTQTLAVPEVFSLVNETNKTLQFLKMVSNACKFKNVQLDFRTTKKMTSDAVTLLVAMSKDNRFSKNRQIKANVPHAPELVELMEECGYFRYVNHKNRSFRQLETLNDGNLVDSKLAGKITKAIFSDKPTDYFFEILVELMQNTSNHSRLSDSNSAHWWACHCKQENKTVFSFVDLGVGIFESIERKVAQKIKHWLLSRDMDLANELLKGTLHSRIRKDNSLRGKGLPQILDNCQHEFFDQALIITNSVRINLLKKTVDKLEYDFSGTFFYFEICTNE